VALTGLIVGFKKPWGACVPDPRPVGLVSPERFSSSRANSLSAG
jgi:hypothetical protein